jgi:hypothetical protein
VRVLVVDDLRAFRCAARRVTGASQGLELVGQGTKGEELEFVEGLRPDLVLATSTCPHARDRATPRIAAACPQRVAALISTEEGEDVPPSARSCGAVAWLCKEDFGPGVLAGLRQRSGRPAL